MRRTTALQAMSLALAAAAGCQGGADAGQRDVASPTAFRDGISPSGQRSDTAPIIDNSVDYGLALRSAALRLTGNYPTLSEIKAVSGAADPATAYAKIIDDYLSRPAFAVEMFQFFRDTFKMGTQTTVAVNGQMVNVNFDAAPAFAAQLVVTEQPFTNIMTAQSGTCPSFNAATGQFAAGDCGNGIPAVGVLTDPGMHAQFFSSMAFRRTRWVQEIFMCSQFPAETSGTPQKHPGGTYFNPWDFHSVAGGPMAKVDFQSDTSLICANCHATINHMAPLLGKFDEAGRPTADFSVHTPVPGNPATVLADWLRPGEGYAWRYNKPVSDLKGLGAAIAADPGMPSCMATRVWNWALSRGDVVIDQATLTQDLLAQLSGSFKQNNYNMKKLVRDVFTSAAFVRY